MDESNSITWDDGSVDVRRRAELAEELKLRDKGLAAETEDFFATYMDLLTELIEGRLDSVRIAALYSILQWRQVILIFVVLFFAV